ncbi:SRPBCC family protein [Shimia sp.]|uniref:SRPBCC family protein n=1 Tax=Shimia sp. TaxID=1954381 RepID=UPI00329A10AC
MEFTSREDIDVPIEQAFEMISDFEQFERAALRRGAEVSRMDDLSRPGVGARWDVGFTFRGKARAMQLEVTNFERPNEIQLKAVAQGINADIKFELVALSRSRTRLNVWSGLKANTLSARLLVQSLKLARGTLTNRLDKRITALGRDMEDRYSKMA